eukprot:gnl/TRDRNA2_/TRDRNA2_199758_c0_seq1.p1 gnl/TRDRNA2_/TRDRNA2_199758_c0~~gnl/TRDRNA2_/TRDRNA2_199758_c0_seq1.p1  ORF type:complete len:754 (-),score=105.84 gnl/TRDRNA2_/TRDRNA2_199758_c0_seq1:68-2143(-)
MTGPLVRAKSPGAIMMAGCAPVHRVDRYYGVPLSRGSAGSPFEELERPASVRVAHRAQPQRSLRDSFGDPPATPASGSKPPRGIAGDRGRKSTGMVERPDWLPAPPERVPPVPDRPPTRETLNRDPLWRRPVAGGSAPEGLSALPRRNSGAGMGPGGMPGEWGPGPTGPLPERPGSADYDPYAVEVAAAVPGAGDAAVYALEGEPLRRPRSRKTEPLASLGLMEPVMSSPGQPKPLGDEAGQPKGKVRQPIPTANGWTSRPISRGKPMAMFIEETVQASGAGGERSTPTGQRSSPTEPPPRAAMAMERYGTSSTPAAASQMRTSSRAGASPRAGTAGGERDREGRERSASQLQHWATGVQQQRASASTPNTKGHHHREKRPSASHSSMAAGSRSDEAMNAQKASRLDERVASLVLAAQHDGREAAPALGDGAGPSGAQRARRLQSDSRSSQSPSPDLEDEALQRPRAIASVDSMASLSGGSFGCGQPPHHRGVDTGNAGEKSLAESGAFVLEDLDVDEVRAESLSPDLAAECCFQDGGAVVDKAGAAGREPSATSPEAAAAVPAPMRRRSGGGRAERSERAEMRELREIPKLHEPVPMIPLREAAKGPSTSTRRRDQARIKGISRAERDYGAQDASGSPVHGASSGADADGMGTAPGSARSAGLGIAGLRNNHRPFETNLAQEFLDLFARN